MASELVLIRVKIEMNTIELFACENREGGTPLSHSVTHGLSCDLIKKINIK